MISVLLIRKKILVGVLSTHVEELLLDSLDEAQNMACDESNKTFDVPRVPHIKRKIY